MAPHSLYISANDWAAEPLRRSQFSIVVHRLQQYRKHASSRGSRRNTRQPRNMLRRCQKRGQKWRGKRTQCVISVLVLLADRKGLSSKIADNSARHLHRDGIALNGE